jgi:hypothetical protein
MTVQLRLPIHSDKYKIEKGLSTFDHSTPVWRVVEWDGDTAHGGLATFYNPTHAIRLIVLLEHGIELSEARRAVSRGAILKGETR